MYIYIYTCIYIYIDFILYIYIYIYIYVCILHTHAHTLTHTISLLLSLSIFSYDHPRQDRQCTSSASQLFLLYRRVIINEQMFYPTIRDITCVSENHVNQYTTFLGTILTNYSNYTIGIPLPPTPLASDNFLYAGNCFSLVYIKVPYSKTSV